MPLRSTMADIIAEVRLMIADPVGANQFFQDIDIQNKLDRRREDIRYESLAIAPSIVNTASTNNIASYIFADYYSAYQNWEADAVLQGVNTSTNAAWVVLTPLASDYIVGRWQFELTPFVNGTAPGQYPPVYATGKVYDLYGAAADLLKNWAASLAGAYDITVAGQGLHRSQMQAQKLAMAREYLRNAKTRTAKIVRNDVAPEMDSKSTPLLGGGSGMSGVY